MSAVLNVTFFRIGWYRLLWRFWVKDAYSVTVKKRKSAIFALVGCDFATGIVTLRKQIIFCFRPADGSGAFDCGGIMSDRFLEEVERCRIANALPERNEAKLHFLDLADQGNQKV
jgi:hypothetical protein